MVLLALSLSSASAMEFRDRWDPEHPIALGSRAALWQADYRAPGVGGQLHYQPWQRLGVEGFWNSFALPEAGLLRHDHVIGFHLYSPWLGGARRWVGPTFGSCVDFRFLSPLGTDEALPGQSDILFGVHTGLMGMAYLFGGWSLQTTVEVFGYWGNQAKVDGWAATASNQLHFQPVLQGSVGLNHWF